MPLTAEDSASIAAIREAFEAPNDLTVGNEVPNPGQADLLLDTLRAGRAGRLDLNTATFEQLDALPGIGPVLAKRILEARASLQSFRSPEELLEIPGIGPQRLAKILPLVFCSSPENR